MSSIDQRIVEMQFDNRQFESGVKTTISTLDRLKQKLNFGKSAQSLDDLSKASKRFSLDGLASSVEYIASKFSFMGIMGVTAMHRISNAAITTGKRLVSALTIDPIRSGLSEYETQIGAIQTILSNTRSKGTTLDQVNNALDELNAYADKTIYNFTEMTRNIGTFTAAGVDLDTSVAAIKGIANLAAVSGSTSVQAATAMYQLSQALASGTIRLMDWNSVVNAGMGGDVLQSALKETARVHGIAIDQMIEEQGSFRETLQKGWLTSEIMLETLQKFTGDLSKEQILAMGYTAEQAEEIIALGKDANDAATKVKTFTQLIDTLKEALGSGWTQTWEFIIGDFEEARTLWTDVSDAIGEVINNTAEARNSMVKAWKEAGGRDDLIEGLTDIFGALWNIVTAVGDAMDDIFPPATVDTLLNISSGVKEFGDNLQRLFGIIGQAKVFTGEDITTTETVGGVDFFGDSLSRGARNDAVKKLQQYLKDAGYDLGNAGVDGIFGPMTEAALKEFQESAGIVIDGVYSEETHNALMDTLGLGPKEITTVEKGRKTINYFSSALQRLRNIAEGAFAVLHIAWQGIQFVGNIIGHVLKLLAPVGDAILTVAEGIAGCFVNLNEWLEESGLFGDWLDSIVEFLRPVGDWFESVGQSIKNFFGFGDGASKTTGVIQTFGELWENIINKVSSLDVWGKIGEAFEKVKLAFSDIIPVLQQYWNAFKVYLGDKFGGLIDWFGDKIPDFIGSIGDFFLKALEFIEPLVRKIPTAFEKVKEFFSGLTPYISNFVSKIPGFISKIKDFFSGLSPYISDFVSKIPGFIGKIKDFFAGVLPYVGDFVGKIPNFVGKIKDFFVGLYEQLKSSDKFQNGVKNVLGFLSDLWEGIKWFFAEIGAAFGGLFSSGVASAEGIGENVKESIDSVGNIGDWLSTAWSKISDVFSVIFEAVGKFIDQFGGMGGLVGAIALIIGVKSVYKFSEAAGGFAEALGGMAAGLSSFGKLGESLNFFVTGFWDNLKKVRKTQPIAKSIMELAISIGIIAAAIWVLGNMDADTLKQGAIAVGGVIAALIILSAISSKLVKNDPTKGITNSANTLRTLGAALLMMGVAVKLMGGMDLWSLIKGIVGIIALVVTLKALMKSLSKSGGNVQVKGFFSLALALGVLIGVMKLINTMTIGEYVGGLLGLIGLMLTLRIFIGAMKKVQGGTIKIKGFLSLGLALGVLIGVMNLINKMTFGEYVTGLLGLIGLLVVLRVFVGSMRKAGDVKFSSMAGLIAISTAIAILTGLMGVIGKFDWGSLAKGLIGLIGVAAALNIASRSMGNMNAKAGVGAFIQCIGLAVVIGSFANSLKSIQVVNTDKIIAFAAGLSGVLFAFSSLTKNAGAVGFKGVGASLLSILGVVGIMAAVVSAFSLLSNIPGFQGFVNKGTSSIGEAIGSFLGAMEAAKFKEMSKGLNELDDAEIDSEKLNNVLEQAQLISDFANGLSGTYSGFDKVLAVLGPFSNATDMGLFSKDMMSFGIGFKSFADSINTVPNVTGDLSGKVESAIAIAQALQDFNTGLKGNYTSLERVLSWMGGNAVTDLGMFSEDMAAFGEGFNGFATAMAPIEVTEDLSSKTTSAIAIAQALQDFNTGLKGNYTSLERVLSWMGGDAVTDLGIFSGDIGTFATGFNNFATTMGQIEIAEDLSTKTTSAIAIAQALQDFNTGLKGNYTSLERVLSWMGGDAVTDMGLFAGDMTAFSTGFNNFATAMSGINEIEDLSSKVTYALGIAQAIQDFNAGLAGNYTDATRILNFMNFFGSAEVTDMEIFTGDMNTFAENFNKFTTAMEGVKTSEELSTKVEDALEIANQVATFIDGLSEFDIEKNAGEVAKWFTGDTTQTTLFSNISELATSMSGLATAFPGISEEGNTVKEDVEEVVGIVEDIARLITNISDRDNYKLDASATDNITSATTNVFNLLLGYITSMSQTIHTFMQDTKDFDVERFKDFINPIVGLGNVLTSIGTGETDGSMDGLNSLLGNFTTTISGFLEGLNVEEINTKAAELDAAIQNVRNILSGGGENGEEGGTTTGLLGGLSSEDVSATISSFASSLGDSTSSLSSVGSELGSAVSSGMGTNVDTSGAKALVDALVGTVRMYQGNAYSAGYYLSQGVANGIRGGGGIVKSAARTIISNALSAMRAEADEHSPSKETEKIARFMDMGLANGLNGYSKIVSRAAEGVAGEAIDSTRSTLANLSTVLSEDMDTTPVIRPVMDMSNISAGARTINGIFSGGRTLSVGVTAAKAQAVSAAMRESRKRQNGSNDATSLISHANDSSVNLTGNNFYIRSDQDVRALASEIAALTRQQQRSYGAT